MAKHYQRILAVGAVLVFFTDLPIYLSRWDTAALNPWYWVAAFGIVAAPRYFSSGAFTVIKRSPVVYWGYGFIVISGAWIFFQGAPSDVVWQEFRTRILSVFLLLMLLCIFSDENAQTWARGAIFAAVLLAVVLNVYELFYPRTFSFEIGRSAGLYVNANKSGAALILGMIFSLGVLRQRYRLFFVLVVGLGVLVTFSRGALVGWLISVLLFTLVGEINLKLSLIVGCAAVALTAIVLSSQWNKLQYQLDDKGVLNKDVVKRIEGFYNVEDFGDDESAALRRDIAGKAWQMFTNKPILGHGVGASAEWGFETGAHNQYLSLMVDHGVLGFFILPVLVIAAAWRARGEAKRICVVFAAFVFSWGVFSHNMLGEYYFLLTFSLMGAIAVSSRLSQKHKDELQVESLCYYAALLQEGEKVIPDTLTLTMDRGRHSQA